MSILLDENGLILFEAPRRSAPEIKQELGGRFDKKSGLWKLPPISLNVLKLVEFYGEGILDGAPEEVIDLYAEPWGFAGFSDEELEMAEAHPRWGDLYEFQKEAVEFYFCNPHACGLLGLSPGLGKTAVSVVTFDLLALKRVLVLAPLTLAKAWGAEIQAWAGDERDVRRATAGDRDPGDGITVTNHEVIQELILKDEEGQISQPEWISNARKVKEWIQEGPLTEDPKTGKRIKARKRIVRIRRDYLGVDWDLVIADESILLKNRKAVKTDVLMTLRKEVKDAWFWELSGAAISKYRDDLYRQMQIMYPRAFTSYWRFAEFFCIVDKDGWGWTIEGDKPNVDAHLYLKDLLFVRSQEEVLPELPKYILQELPLDATPAQRKALDSMFDDWIVEAEEEPDETVEASNWLARMVRLEQITSNMASLPKPSGKGFFPESSATTDALIEKVKNEEVEYPMLVWTWFVETARVVEKRLKKSNKKLRVASVVGPDKSSHKDKVIQDFKDGELDVLVMQMGVGKYGHTFTKTKTVFYHDLTSAADPLLQSLRRVPRIGLKHRPLLIIPKIEDSAYEIIQANLDDKLPSIAKLTKSDLAAALTAAKDEAGVPSLISDYTEGDDDEE